MTFQWQEKNGAVGILVFICVHGLTVERLLSELYRELWHSCAIYCSSSLLASHHCLYFIWNMEKMYFVLIVFHISFVILLDESTKSTMCKCLVGGGLCNLVISLITSVQTLFLLQVSRGWCSAFFIFIFFFTFSTAY